MSGGQFDYSGQRIESYLTEISTNEDVSKRFPQLSMIFGGLARILYEIEHDIDWDLSGDSSIKNDREFDTTQTLRLLINILMAIDDNPILFHRGKWATIQALAVRATNEHTFELDREGQEGSS